MQELSKNGRAYYVFVNDIGLVKFIRGMQKQEALRDDWTKLQKLIDRHA